MIGISIAGLTRTTFCRFASCIRTVTNQSGRLQPWQESPRAIETCNRFPCLAPRFDQGLHVVVLEPPLDVSQVLHLLQMDM